MRIIGLDVGTKTIGVAVSDIMGWTAQGVTTVKRSYPDSDVAAIKKYIDEFEAGQVMIGLPLNMNGSAGPSVDMVRLFGEQLAAGTTVPIVYRDERLSTMAAERYLLDGDVSRKKRKKVIDKMAAVFVLQGYLDYLANNGGVEQV
ncbi:MAG: Holliday junction resolvase RuvX [Firmicutes bacterium]|nr:Holliday junction resolvase RuvX [Bacillota bacterium]